MGNEYNHKEIEKKWQKHWEDNKTFITPDKKRGQKNEYNLVEFAYPSGNLHVGHWYAFTPPDMYARLRIMQGNNVMFPFGFDAFGLPAENAAIKNKINPKKWTYQNIDYMRNQLKSMGNVFDWDREVTTCDPEYYKWTQWLFLKFYKKGLAYQSEKNVNWCPSCKTVLANEQVVNGHCERCDTLVVQKKLNQWQLKITKYADRLIDDLDNLDWPDPIKESQKNWIGRSHGVNLKSKIKDLNIEYEAYDSIPQTYMAQTFTIIAPEHPMIYELVKGTDKESEVMEFVERIKKKKLENRFDIEKDMEGIFTGRYVENFADTGRDLPIWVASFAVYDYGTGIVNCSAHDERDYNFAKKYDIPLHPVLFPENKEHAKRVKNLEKFYREPNGVLQEPEQFKGRKWYEVREDIIDHLIKSGFATRKTNYKLRDWSVSRQRYWGCPIPIIHCEKCGVVPIPEKQLPVELPEIDDFVPGDDGKSPLSKIDNWVDVKCPKCNGSAKRETDTLDTFVDSSWYFLRYLDSKNTKKFAHKKMIKNWMPINFYSGGAEHTTMHLLFARFFYKVLFDLKFVKESEPFVKRMNRGIILGPDGNKMSKSKGNVIDPDEIVQKLGADTVRTYLAFIGPYNEVGHYPWNPDGVVGIRRFLEKVWRIANGGYKESSESIKKNLHKTIKKVTESYSQLKFNTGIAQLMAFSNLIEKESISKEDFSVFIQLLTPVAPHICEELWQKIGNKGLVSTSNWPSYDFELAKDDSVVVGVQVNGKVRDEIELGVDEDESSVKEKVMASKKIQKWLDGKEVKKFVYVKGKIVNIVV